MSSVKISELNLLQVSSISTDDFLPLVDSGSLTTYRISLDDFNNWLDASGSVNTASYANSSSYAISASYANSASYSITSSYAIFSTDAYWAVIATNADNSDTASYAKTASILLGTLDTASYAKTSSISLSSSYALTASYELSSSYALSSSYGYSSSYAIIASNAITASYAQSTSPTALVYPPLISGLRIIPSWKTYGLVSDYSDIPFQQFVIKVNAAVLTDSATGTNSKVLQNLSVLVDRNLPVGTATANTGSLDTGVFANNGWYNIWLIYSSTLDITSAMICATSGGNVNTSPLMPVGFDYWTRIGVIKDSAGIFWREWYEFGTIKKWFYRTSMPSGYGTSGGGLTLTHYLEDVPRNTSIKLKLKKISGASSIGFTLGDELRSEDFISDIDSGEVDIPIFGTITTATTLKIWRTVAGHGIKSSRSTDGTSLDWGNAATSAPYFDLLISSEI